MCSVVRSGLPGVVAWTSRRSCSPAGKGWLSPITAMLPKRSRTSSESPRTRCCSAAPRRRTATTIAAGVLGCARSQRAPCSDAVSAMASLRHWAIVRSGRSTSRASRCPPRRRTYQAVPCSQPDSIAAGELEPSRSTRASGVATAKSSLTRSGRCASPAISMRMKASVRCRTGRRQRFARVSLKRGGLSGTMPPARPTSALMHRQYAIPSGCLYVSGSSSATSMARAVSAREMVRALATAPPTAVRN